MSEEVTIIKIVNTVVVFDVFNLGIFFLGEKVQLNVCH